MSLLLRSLRAAAHLRQPLRPHAVPLLRPAPAAVRRASTTAFAADGSTEPEMFCFQCEQTENGTGCTTVGVCGKSPLTAALQDALVDEIKHMSFWATKAREAGAPENAEGNAFTLSGLFSTLTNVNFDDTRFTDGYLQKAADLREQYKADYAKYAKAEAKEYDTHTLPDLGAADPSTILAEGRRVGVLAHRKQLGEEIANLHEFVVYGLKGAAAYADHAAALGRTSDEVYASMQKLLAQIHNSPEQVLDFDQLVAMVKEVGSINLKVLEMLDAGHTETLGHPVPTETLVTPVPGKCILVSGHDLHDLEQLLQQTEGKGINVYTHGEMLPAHGYPALNKYKHLVGNYGGAWNLQKFEFAKFPGPIVMTTNCLIEPRKSYKDRIYTCNAVGFAGVKHIETSETGKKDFSAVIAQAQGMDGFVEGKIRDAPQKITVGFGRNAILQNAGAVVDAVKKGDITHFFLIGGCDGSEGERNYFKELALSTPESSVILTLGCGKYRFNKFDLGTVPNVGIPRVLDMGQCNDSYGAVVVATELAKAFGCGVNDLPLSFAISHLEQKACAVLCTLVSLGIKNIHLGPTAPAYLGPKMAQLLTEGLGLRICDAGHVENDLERFLGKTA